MRTQINPGDAFLQLLCGPAAARIAAPVQHRRYGSGDKTQRLGTITETADIPPTNIPVTAYVFPIATSRDLTMLWNSARSPLEPEEEDWIISCWQWLLQELGDMENLRRTPLVLPTGDFFAPAKATGHARAEHIFNCVARLTGTADWPYTLMRQEEAINPVLGPLAMVQNAPSDPAGTFAVETSRQIRITYNSELVSQPGNLIATFAHEIAHGLLLTAHREPPGGRDFEEYAVDVTTVFLGFGIFGANHAFEFSQYSDAGSGTQGWSYRRTGYLSEAQWGFNLGIFLYLRGEPPETALRWLKPGPAAALRKTLKYLGKHPERVAVLAGGAG